MIQPRYLASWILGGLAWGAGLLLFTLPSIPASSLGLNISHLKQYVRFDPAPEFVARFDEERRKWQASRGVPH